MMSDERSRRNVLALVRLYQKHHGCTQQKAAEMIWDKERAFLGHDDPKPRTFKKRKPKKRR